MGREEITILTDEDSYGPTPPPPSHPHPDDVEVNNAKKDSGSRLTNVFGGNSKRSSKASTEPGVQIQGIDDVFKHDPPTEIETKGDGIDDDVDTDEAEDLSVEIPPTTVVQRMLAKEEHDFEKRVDNTKWMRVGAVVCGLLVLLAIILGAGYGSGAFSKSSSSQQSSGGSGSGDSSNQDASRPAAIASYLETVSTQGASSFDTTNNSTSPESLAMNWLINDDPLQLSPSSESDKFRLAQRYALLTLWFGSKAYWKEYTGWTQAEDECTWFGVTCEQMTLNGAGDQNVVTQLSMESNGVQALSADLFTLDNLKVLSLSDNIIQGKLPSSVSNATSLVELYLESNLLAQDLSDFDWSKLTNLEVLRLGMNNFTGSIHDSLWTLTNLQEIVLDSCGLTGKIPKSVANLENLVTFDVSSNNIDNTTGFHGSLPTYLASLPKLQVLALGGNAFSGSIPSEYANFPALTELNIADNQLTGSILKGISALPLTILRVGGNSFDQGSIPTHLYDMTTLQVLDLHNCQFDGAIDPSIANLVNLVELNVGGNFLTSSPPTELQTMKALEVLQLDNNFFGGSLDFVTSLSSLVDLNVATNQFTGFPDVSSLSNLQFLRAYENQLGTTFPESVTLISNLTYLDLSASSLTGQLPTTLGDMAALEQLRLDGNAFSGPIPDSISGMSNLKSLKLDTNILSSSIPSTITSLTNLEELELQSNKLTGTIPLDIGGLYNLKLLRLNLNNDPNGNGNAKTGISGPLPSSLGNMLFLEVMEVYNNLLTGKLPTAMGNLRRLRYLDIEYNDFTGSIPSEWAGMSSLHDFYLSNTKLTGSFPSDICTIQPLTYLVTDCTISNCTCCSSCN